MYQRILLPTDGSALSDQVLPLAFDLARQWHSALIAVTVVQPALVLPPSEAALTIDVVGETQAMVDAARAQVDRVHAAAVAAGVPCTALTVVAHSVHKALLETASAQHCDLILMASHGRHGLSRLLAGSQTQKVMSESPIPVLVLHPGTAPATVPGN